MPVSVTRKVMSGSEDRRIGDGCSILMSDAPILTSDFRPPAVIDPLLRELAGVAQEVEQRLPHLGHVGAHHADVPGQITSRRLPFLATSGCTVAATSWTILADVELLEVERHLAGFDLREIEDVVDEAEQVFAGAVDAGDVLDVFLAAVGFGARPGAFRCSR